MTYPVGLLPQSGQVADLSRVRSPSKSVAFAHGGSDLDLTDPANGLTPCATEFYVTVAGNLVARLAGDSADRTYIAVTVGQIVPGLFTLIKGSSTADGFARGI
jgi:hypothetical protein